MNTTRTCSNCGQVNLFWANKCRHCDHVLVMTRADWEKLMEATVDRHIFEMKQKAAQEQISEDDHDRIGFLLQREMHHLMRLSDEAWLTFQRIIEESRKVQALPHEPKPRSEVKCEACRRGWPLSTSGLHAVPGSLKTVECTA